ncbi:uncharacterized protein LOC121277499 isoform X2 [Carcharodon carcharias]|uniref:uncharacterized protein LOC121277499 isoform X2 n=1 Tax=Carcharodon carcharias TaxID=13397 RepID=UPI001B7E1A04|nr:uncharacterized protein LOC121277499 isoform X2 [Carcharodon carcharias]XP_041042991.1 uncharacterized protein LOC121277499 isoform X2 [Carcharodon carcharias]
MVSELLLAIESLSKEWMKSHNEQKHVKKIAEAHRLQLPNMELSATNENQHIKTAKSPERSNISSGSSKRFTFTKWPQQSIFECKLDAKPLNWNIDTKLQVNRKPKLVCNWPQKPKLDHLFDRGIISPKKKYLNIFDGEYFHQSHLIPFQPEKSRKQRPGAEKTRQVGSPCPNMKSILIRRRIQQSVLAGTIHYEPFIDLKDLQWKLYKGAVRREPKVLMDEHKCKLHPILTGRQHKEALPVPLICKGNKYIEAF